MARTSETEADTPLLMHPSTPLPSAAVFRIGDVRWRLAKAAASVTVSSDCKLVALAAHWPVVQLAHLATGEPFTTLDAGACHVSTVQCAPDSSLLAGGTDEGPVLIWDLASLKQVAALRRFRRPVTTLAWVRGSNLLLVGSERAHVVAWDVVRGRVAYQRHFAGWFSERSLSLSLSGNEAAIYGFIPVVFREADVQAGKGSAGVQAGKGPGCTILVWESHTGALLHELRLPYDWVRCVLAADGRHVYVATDEADLTCDLWLASTDGGELQPDEADRTCDLWLASTDGRELQPIAKGLRFIDAMALSPSGEHLALGTSERNVLVLHVESGRSRCIAHHASSISQLVWTPDGQQLLSVSDDNLLSIDRTTASATPPVTIGHRAGVTAICTGEKSPWFVTASKDGTVRLWDAIAAQEQHRLALSAERVSMSRSGRYVVIGTWDSVCLWEPGREAAAQEIWKGSTRWDDLFFLADESGLVTVSLEEWTAGLFPINGGVKPLFVALTPPRPLVRCGRERANILAAALVHNELWIAFEGELLASYELPTFELLKWWRVEADGAARTSVEGILCDPGAKRVIYGLGDRGLIADVSSPESATDLGVEGMPEQWSPNGELLLIWSGWHYHIWSILEKRVVGQLDGHPGGVSCATFSPDGQRVLTGGWEGLIIGWELSRLMREYSDRLA